jgi:hypothetical protein
LGLERQAGLGTTDGMHGLAFPSVAPVPTTFTSQEMCSALARGHLTVNQF